MKTHIRKLLAIALLACAHSAAAQSPDALIDAKRNGATKFRVNVDGGIVAYGVFDEDIDGNNVPAEGSGTRLVWYPNKAAFRAGGITGTQWDAANIGEYSVAIGLDVRASGDYAVAMGLRATAANSSSIALGEDVTATGFASVALGYRAHTNTKRGSFVFSDNISSGTQDSIRAEFPAQALWRVSCGMQIYTAQNKTTGVGIGGPAVNPTVCTGGSNYWGQSNAMISTSTGAYLHTNGTWNNASDVNRKRDFADISGEFVLAKLRTMPIRTWTYNSEDRGVRHIGPTAQDFYKTFQFGTDDKAIGTVDADGVALASAQALEARTRALSEELAARGRQIDALLSERALLLERLDKLEAAVNAKK